MAAQRPLAPLVGVRIPSPQKHCYIAQLAERRLHIPKVPGSSPGVATKHFTGSNWFSIREADSKERARGLSVDLCENLLTMMIANDNIETFRAAA